MQKSKEMHKDVTEKSHPPKRRDYFQREKELVLKVQEARTSLLASNRLVSRRNIADEVGMSVSGLNYYTMVRWLLEEIVKESGNRHQRFVLRQNQIAAKVKQAIVHLRNKGERLSQQSVSKLAGISVSTLNRYPEVVALLVLNQVPCKELRKVSCLDCGVNTILIHENYRLHDEIWKTINPQYWGEGMLCIRCAERG